MSENKTPAQIKADFQARGVPVAEWADKHGYDRALVYRLLNGRAVGMRGKTHEVAVALGLKADPSKLNAA